MKRIHLYKALKKCNKRMLTLMEMMVVIFLIGIITAVVAYNYQGTMEKGRILKTQQSIDKVETILNLRVAEDPDLLNNIKDNWVEIIESDPIVKDSKALIKDGWGNPLIVEVDQTGAIKVSSSRLRESERRN
jgi:general secretion pathway protein G